MNNGKTNVKNYTDADIIARVEGLSTFAGWKKGKYEIYVRSQEDEFDKFDDKLYSFEVEEEGKKPVFKMVCTGTTHAGAQGLKNYEKYGNTRCAILKSDYVVYDSHEYGLHKGEYPAYRQCKPWPYYEDKDKDEKAEETGNLVEGKIIYANIHKAGKDSSQIGGWSIACQVRNNEDQYNKWMEYMNKEKYCTLAILKEW